MIDFNRERFPRESNENLQQKLEENLQMQRDCEIEIERCNDIGDKNGSAKTQATLDTLKVEEISIREQLGN